MDLSNLTYQEYIEKLNDYIRKLQTIAVAASIGRWRLYDDVRRELLYIQRLSPAIILQKKIIYTWKFQDFLERKRDDPSYLFTNSSRYTLQYFSTVISIYPSIVQIVQSIQIDDLHYFYYEIYSNNLVRLCFHYTNNTYSDIYIPLNCLHRHSYRIVSDPNDITKFTVVYEAGEEVEMDVEVQE